VQAAIKGSLQALIGVALAAGACLLAALVHDIASTHAGPAAQPFVAPAEAPTATVSYQLRANLDVSQHRVEGSGTIRWTNTSQVPQRQLWLHLYLNAFKNERTAFMRSTASGGFRGSNRPSRWGYIQLRSLRIEGMQLWPSATELSPGDAEDETEARVTLPKAVEPGESIVVEVDWVSQLPSVVLRTGFSGRFHMVAQWFPKLARLEPDGTWAHFPFHRLSEFYADYGDYDVTIETPRDFVVGATGAQVQETVDGDRIARRFTIEGVHDFAFTAWDGFAVATAQGPGGVRMRCLYPKGEQAMAQLELDMAAFGLEHFGAAYGAYPYETLTLVHPPATAHEAGGMEYPTLITTGGRWYLPLLGMRAIEAVTIHELAHQWFYGLVGSNEYRWAFLDEGLTTWATMRALEERFGSGAGFDGFGLKVDHHSFLRAQAAEVWANDQIAQPADHYATGADYGRLVYSRTATLLETIGRVWGADELALALGNYARMHRFGHPGPEQLLAAVRRDVGDAAADALRVGLLDTGWLDYQVATVRHHDNVAPKGIYGDPEKPSVGAKVQGGPHRAVVVIRRKGSLQIPVEIELRSDDGVVDRRRYDGRGSHHTIVWTGHSKLATVHIDPEHAIVIDQDLSNNVFRRDASAVAPRSLSHLGFVAQLVMGLVAP